MSLIRDLPYTVRAAEDTILATCSALMSTAESTSPLGMLSNKSTASAVITTGDIGFITTGDGTKLVSSGGMATLNGRLIDRLRIPGTKTLWPGVVVTASLNSTRGSTEADRKLAVGVKLQSGDSSGGGDLADYSTAAQPDDKVFGTSIRTTDMLAWDTAESSGPVYLSQSGYYDLRAAGRYIRVVGRFGKNSVTTESSGDEHARVSLDATFVAGDDVPKADTTSPFSSSTSTA